MFCPYCHEHIIEDSDYCFVCGKIVVKREDEKNEADTKTDSD